MPIKKNYPNRERERERWPNRAILSEVLRIRERQRWPERAVGLQTNECFCRVSGGVFEFSESLAPKKRAKTFNTVPENLFPRQNPGIRKCLPKHPLSFLLSLPNFLLHFYHQTPPKPEMK
jgi:hypothetical protein